MNHIPIILFFCVFFAIMVPNNIWAIGEPIFITKSADMNKVVFDGKWSFVTEWKPSSLNSLSYNDNSIIQLRTAHQDNFVYVMIDFVSDTHLDKGMDKAIVCFDTKNDKSKIAKQDDYCFSVSLNGKTSFTYQGGSPIALHGNFMTIPNPDGLIGVSTSSDQNDRYSSIPHSSYEFKIPTDLIGRSNVYGFYVGVYDDHSKKVYSWPQEIKTKSLLHIPSPKLWGEIVSPDKSLPEFELPMLALLPAFTLIVLISYLKKCNHFKT